MTTLRIPYPTDFAAVRNIDRQQWGVLINSTFPNATSQQAILDAWDLAHVKGLDVFSGHVAIVSQRRKVDGRWVDFETSWLTLKSLVYLAHRTGAFAGIDPIQFGPIVERNYEGYQRDDGGRNAAKSIPVKTPEYVTATVYRFVNGVRCAFSDTVFFDEMVSLSQGVPNAIWRTKPALMLAKCAKASALRLGFAECDFAAEEMDGQEVTNDVVAEPSSITAPYDVSDAPANKTPEPAPFEDTGFGEAVGRFEQIPRDKLEWLDRNMENALGVGAFEPAVANLQGSIDLSYHKLGVTLIRSVEKISNCPTGRQILTYIGKAREHAAQHGVATYDTAIEQMNTQAKAGRIDEETNQAVYTYLTFLKALSQAA